MKKIFSLLLVIVSINAFGQSRIPIRGDSIVIEKIGGNAELIIRNSTRQLEYGDLILYKKEFWILVDWCRGCQLVWIQTLGERKAVSYGKVKKIKSLS